MNTNQILPSNMSAYMKFYYENATSVTEYDECISRSYYGKADFSVVRQMIKSDKWDSVVNDLVYGQLVVVAKFTSDTLEYAIAYNRDTKMLKFYHATTK